MSGTMTPAEQDKELRENITRLLTEASRTFNHDNPAEKPYTVEELHRWAFDLINEQKRLYAEMVVGDFVDLDEARQMQRVVKDETNGTRHSLDPNAVTKAIAVNHKITEQKARIK